MRFARWLSPTTASTGTRTALHRSSAAGAHLLFAARLLKICETFCVVVQDEESILPALAFASLLPHPPRPDGRHLDKVAASLPRPPHPARLLVCLRIVRHTTANDGVCQVTAVVSHASSVTLAVSAVHHACPRCIHLTRATDRTCECVFKCVYD